MIYETYVRNLCKTSQGRMYLALTANKLKEEKDIKSLQYLYACICSSGDSIEITKLASRVQEMVDDIS